MSVKGRDGREQHKLEDIKIAVLRNYRRRESTQILITALIVTSLQREPQHALSQALDLAKRAHKMLPLTWRNAFTSTNTFWL